MSVFLHFDKTNHYNIHGMGEIIPFRGLRYNIGKIGDYDKVIAPPYDVISSNMQDELYNESEFNIVRLIHNRSRGDGRYLEAAQKLNEWQQQDILVRDEKPAIYVYEQDFMYHSKMLKRRGFIAALKLRPLGEGLIYPHEKTMSKPRQDRLSLLKATNANLSPIFALYIDGSQIKPVLEDTANKEAKINAIDPTGVVQKLWLLQDKEKIEIIQKAMKGKELFIADGHHRYETSLMYQQEKSKKTNGNSLTDYTMVMFVDMGDDGVVIKPAHRIVDIGKTSFTSLVETLEIDFKIVEATSLEKLLKMLKQNKDMVTFGLSDGKVFKFLTYKREPEFDLIILHKELERILGISYSNVQDYVEFVDDAGRALNKAKNDNKVVFFVKPTQIDTVKRMARSHQIMPQKSTYFYPKLTDGLVVRTL